MNKTVKRTKVFLDFKINEEEPKRVIILLFDDICPRTTSNFKFLCSGEKGVSARGTTLCYKGSPVHRAYPGFCMQAGDITKGNGTGGESAFEKLLEDENFIIKHNKPGILTMASAGVNTIASQFLITVIPAPWLDDAHVAIGEVVEGIEVIEQIVELGTADTTKLKDGNTVIISDCGESEVLEYVAGRSLNKQNLN